MYRGILKSLSGVKQRSQGLFLFSSTCRMADCVTSASTSDVTLESLRFDNVVLREVPVDTSGDTSQRQVRGACFSKVSTTPVINPKTVVYSADAMNLLGLPESELNRPEFAEFFSGNRLFAGSEPAAHCYCGHQFGFFAGQLGDGAAIYLGEVVNSRNERWEVQLKGAGKTPYSRTADGRKVLRSSIREFLCSEAMHHLGIPTTRAGCCVSSDSTVVRDIFYSGDPISEQCAIVTRIAPSFIRFGSFQICKGPDRESGRDGPSAGHPDIIRQLADYVIRNFYQQIWNKHNEARSAEMYLEFFQEVVRRTAVLVAQWQCVGFCHGVLNTDNMSILGLTIDYGPYGFMDHYDPSHICNASDNGGRYAFSKQPEICKWNCVKLAEALFLLAPMDRLLSAVESFDETFERHYLQGMRRKLGLLHLTLDSDHELVESLLDTMHQCGADFTNTFRSLSCLHVSGDVSESTAELKHCLMLQCANLEDLQNAFAPHMDPRQLAMLMSMIQSSPEFVQQMGRTFQQVLIEVHRMEKLAKLRTMTTDTLAAQNSALWDAWLDKYVKRVTADLADAADLAGAEKARENVMNASNPRIVLRNYMAQMAIDEAEKGDYSEVKHILSLLQKPFDDCLMSSTSDVSTSHTPSAATSAADGDDSTSHLNIEMSKSCSVSAKSYDGKPPSWASQLRVT